MGITAKDRAIDLLHCRVSEALDAAYDEYFDRKERAEATGDKVVPWRHSVESMNFNKDWADEVAVLLELGLAVDGTECPAIREIMG